MRAKDLDGGGRCQECCELIGSRASRGASEDVGIGLLGLGGFESDGVRKESEPTGESLFQVALTLDVLEADVFAGSEYARRDAAVMPSLGSMKSWILCWRGCVEIEDCGVHSERQRMRVDLAARNDNRDRWVVQDLRRLEARELGISSACHEHESVNTGIQDALADLEAITRHGAQSISHGGVAEHDIGHERGRHVCDGDLKALDRRDGECGRDCCVRDQLARVRLLEGVGEVGGCDKAIPVKHDGEGWLRDEANVWVVRVEAWRDVACARLGDKRHSTGGRLSVGDCWWCVLSDCRHAERTDQGGEREQLQHGVRPGNMDVSRFYVDTKYHRPYSDEPT